MPRAKKFNYDGDEFYDELLALAMQGMTDAEIADALQDRFGQKLAPDTFSMMKNGNYDKWTKSENERRSERIVRVLARGRRKINAIVRGAYLKAALGGRKLKNVSTTTRRLRMSDGTLTDEEDVQTTVSEVEQAPSIQALSNWLYHHDEEWRKVERRQEDEERIYSDRGVDIDRWMEENSCND